MIKLMDKSAIIKLKEQGYSNRKIHDMLNIDRKTVAKYWNEYKRNVQKLNIAEGDMEIKEIQEKIVSEPKNNSAIRVRRKITPELQNDLKKILNQKKEKEKIL